ncbi:hypothetical protein A2U01_0108306, partial [Trifolium medium]|nr:hypothetical protein [Trifolium medium]
NGISFQVWFFSNGSISSFIVFSHSLLSMLSNASLEFFGSESCTSSAAFKA